MTEQTLFFTMCKAIRGIQNVNRKKVEEIVVDYANINMFSKDNNPKRIYALMYKLESKGLVVIKKNSYGRYFGLSAKGIEYIKSLKK